MSIGENWTPGDICETWTPGDIGENWTPGDICETWTPGDEGIFKGGINFGTSSLSIPLISGLTKKQQYLKSGGERRHYII